MMCDISDMLFTSPAFINTILSTDSTNTSLDKKQVFIYSEHDVSDTDITPTETHHKQDVDISENTDIKTVHDVDKRLAPQKKVNGKQKEKQPKPISHEQQIKNALFGAFSKHCGATSIIGFEANQTKFIARELAKLIPENQFTQPQIDTMASYFVRSCQKIAKYEKFVMKETLPSQYYKYLAHIVKNITDGEKKSFVDGLRDFLNDNVKVKPMHENQAAPVKKQIYG